MCPGCRLLGLPRFHSQLKECPIIIPGHPRAERLQPAQFQSIPVPSNSHERTAAIRTPFQLSERRLCWRELSGSYAPAFVTLTLSASLPQSGR